MCYGLAEWRVPILDELDGRDGAPCRVLTMMSGGGDDLREEVRFVVAPTSEGRQPRTTGVIDAHPFTTPCGSDIPSSLCGFLKKVDSVNVTLLLILLYVDFLAFSPVRG